MSEGTRWWRLGWCACPGCGSLFIRESSACAECDAHLRAHARAALAIETFGTHRYLFDWIPGADDVLSHLILALKGTGREQAWDHWAQLFVQRHATDLPDLRQVILYSSPTTRSEDHSSAFARALARRLGVPFGGRPLEKTTTRASRHLSKRARRERDDLVKSTACERPGKRKAVLVDDVLTTGATARAVRQALGSPPGFEVWTLALRTSPSCGASAPMIGS